MMSHRLSETVPQSQVRLVDRVQRVLNNAAMASELWQRIRAIQRHMGLTQEEFGQHFGVSKSAVSQWESLRPENRTTPGLDVLQKMSAVSGAPISWLISDESDCEAQFWIIPGEDTTIIPATGIAATVGGVATVRTGLQIPLLANSASMGPGADGIAEDVIQGTLTVSPEWVAQNVRLTRTDALRFIHGHGDSMAPTFNSGDVLLVDTGVRDVKVDGVYVLQAHDRLFIKRVRQRLDGAHEISSDNPTHKTVDTLNGDHRVEILGRVVWAWNGKKM